MKNVYVMTATQNQQIGYALDSKWYGIGEFTVDMREQLGKLTRDDVNRGASASTSRPETSRSSSSRRTRKGLKDKLVADAFSPIKYDGEKPQELLDEDKVIGARKLGYPENVRITPVEEVIRAVADARCVGAGERGERLAEDPAPGSSALTRDADARSDLQYRRSAHLAPLDAPQRLARFLEGKSSVRARTGMLAASSRNSSASRRV